jgi:hypothetical protein
MPVDLVQLPVIPLRLFDRQLSAALTLPQLKPEDGDKYHKRTMSRREYFVILHLHLPRSSIAFHRIRLKNYLGAYARTHIR